LPSRPPRQHDGLRVPRAHEDLARRLLPRLAVNMHWRGLFKADAQFFELGAAQKWA
jgi:hypothetical protein